MPGAVTITNPGKVLFRLPGHTKRDLVRYYLAVADGALQGAGDRPNVLVRYPDGAWTRIRVNLRHVPDHLRPTQEPLDPDGPPDDRSGVSPGADRPRTRSRARTGS